MLLIFGCLAFFVAKNVTISFVLVSPSQLIALNVVSIFFLSNFFNMPEEILASVKHPGLKMVVLMHMSETNNHPEIAKITALQALGESSPQMILAQQDHPTELLSV